MDAVYPQDFWADYAHCLYGQFPSMGGARYHNALTIYRNNALRALCDTLLSHFPVTSELLGADFFEAVAVEYVGKHWPHTPVLAEYGAEFPDFLARFPPVQTWPYVAEVARLEWWLLCAYYAADAPVMDVADWQAVLQAQTLATPVGHIVWHPAVRYHTSPYAIVSIWKAHQGHQGATTGPEPRLSFEWVQQPETAWVYRRGLHTGVEKVPLNLQPTLGSWWQHGKLTLLQEDAEQLAAGLQCLQWVVRTQSVSAVLSS